MATYVKLSKATNKTTNESFSCLSLGVWRVALPFSTARGQAVFLFMPVRYTPHGVRKRTEEEILEDFYASFEETDNGCWHWIRNTNRTGYACFKALGTIKANRVAWMLFYGPIPNGCNICHFCDNRACVRPSHLFMGTQADNVRDMVRKKRHMYGNRVPRALINPDIVRELRRRYIPHVVTARSLAKQFNVSEGCVRAVVNWKNWKQVLLLP